MYVCVPPFCLPPRVASAFNYLMCLYGSYNVAPNGPSIPLESLRFLQIRARLIQLLFCSESRRVEKNEKIVKGIKLMDKMMQWHWLFQHPYGIFAKH